MLRLQALQVLQQRGAMDPKQPVEVLMGGKRREMTVTRLNSDFRFAPRLPEKWEKVYIKNIQAGAKKNADWAAMGAVYFEIMNAVPAFYPARYNYAGSLMNRNRMEEAEPILRELVAAHPEYLFASATLLQLLCFQKRMEEADAFIKVVPMPEETHPDAMVAWFLAQNMYYEAAHRPKEARKSIEQALEISPDHPRVKALWKLYGE
jgi:tetratricopeptide (TPR) repeat protein